VPSASDISDSISPGSTEYGDRQVIEDRIQQAAATQAPAAPSGAINSATQDRLSRGPVSDLPVTDGLRLGPGSGPAPAAGQLQGTDFEQLRLIATEARNPLLRKLARDALTARVQRGS